MLYKTGFVSISPKVAEWLATQKCVTDRHKIFPLTAIAPILNGGWGQKEFHTIEIETLDQLEQCFEVNVNVYQMTGKGVVATLRLSLSRFPRSLYLNLYQNHLSWVKNLCEKLFCTQKDLKRHHNSNCSKLTKKTFKGGFYEPPQNLFEQLNQQGFTTASESQFFQFLAF